MGRHDTGQGQLFYSFDLDEVVPTDHLVREIDRVLDLSWVRQELAPYYSATGRPSIDPVLLIRMLVLGYVFAIRSERALCREVQVNLAYRWFCCLSIEDRIPDHSAFTRARRSGTTAPSAARTSSTMPSAIATSARPAPTSPPTGACATMACTPIWRASMTAAPVRSSRDAAAAQGHPQQARGRT